MNPEIVSAANGLPTLKLGDNYLEDSRDPVEGANAFVSAEAIAKATHVILFGLGLGYRIERLKALGAKSIVVFESSKEIRELTKAKFPERIEGTHVIGDPSFVSAFLGDKTLPEDTFTLLVPPAYKRAFPRALETLVAVLTEAQGLTVLRQNTLRERAATLIEAVLDNLGELTTSHLAMRMGTPLKGSAAFIVSAGPSLDKNVHLLEKARKKGALFALNTSAPVFAKRNIPIDVLCAIEVLDISSNLAEAAKLTRMTAVDLSAHPNIHHVGMGRKTTFLSASSQFAPLSKALHTAPLQYGGSVATAAFALAYAWGADPIVLVGQDLAYTDMRCYATGTPYDDMTCRLDGENLVIEGAPIKEEIYKSGGLRPQPRTKPWIKASAWGGSGDVISTHELMSFLRWFDATAWYYQGTRRFINATEGGASMQNFEERTLESVLDELPDATSRLDEAYDAHPPISATELSAIRAEIAKSAKKVGDLAERALAEREPQKFQKALEALRKAAHEAPLVSAHSASGLLKMQREKNLSPEQIEKRTFSEIVSSARRVQKITGA